MQDRFLIDSAGTSGYHSGDGPDPRTSAVAAGRGIVLDHASRRIRPADLERFDYVLAMDTDNLERVHELTGGAEVRAQIALLRSFDPTAPEDGEVPDPYYGGPRGFEDVHDMVERACAGLLAHIRAARGM